MNKLVKTKVSEVRCVQASRCSSTGKEIFTLECSYPRVIHSQLLTHNVFSKNSSSTRAVPLEAAIKQVLENPAKVIWTANQSGMQGNVITDEEQLLTAENTQNTAMLSAIDSAREHSDNNIHKQNAGRLLEPFQNIKIVLTSTEWENWDWLRIHEDAQGEIADLATAMKEARENAEVMEIGEGEWHVPFVHRERGAETGDLYYMLLGESGFPAELTPEEAKAVSVSVCAQTSYRKADYSLEKARKMSGMLLNGHKVHASPFEHLATPVPDLPRNTMNVTEFLANMPEGVTHIDRFATPCSGNFKNWIQYRQLIKNHDKALFEE